MSRDPVSRLRTGSGSLEQMTSRPLRCSRWGGAGGTQAKSCSPWGGERPAVRPQTGGSPVPEAEDPSLGVSGSGGCEGPPRWVPTGSEPPCEHSRVGTRDRTLSTDLSLHTG